MFYLIRLNQATISLALTAALPASSASCTAAAIFFDLPVSTKPFTFSIFDIFSGKLVSRFQCVVLDFFDDVFLNELINLLFHLFTYHRNAFDATFVVAAIQLPETNGRPVLI